MIVVPTKADAGGSKVFSTWNDADIDAVDATTNHVRGEKRRQRFDFG